MKKTVLVFLLILVGLICMSVTKYALLLGARRYEYPNPNFLAYAEKDVKDLERVLKTFGYKTQKIIGAELSKVAVKEALRKIALKSTPEDLLLVFFSGHGAKGINFNRKGIVLTYVTDSDVPNEEFFEQEEFLQTIYQFQGNRVLILESCFQGFEALDVIKQQERETNETFQVGELDLFIASSSNAETSRAYGMKINGETIENGLLVNIFLKGISNRGIDINGDGVVTMGEVAQYVNEFMSTVVQTNISNQNPQAITANPSYVLFSLPVASSKP